jgi:hypothetical protein
MVEITAHEPLREKAEFVYARLKEFFGEPQWQPGDDPVDELIWTILLPIPMIPIAGEPFANSKPSLATIGTPYASRHCNASKMRFAQRECITRKRRVLLRH